MTIHDDSHFISEAFSDDLFTTTPPSKIKLPIEVLSIVFRKFVSDKMKSRAGTRRWSSYAPFNYLKAYAGDGVKSGEAVHLDS